MMPYRQGDISSVPKQYKAYYPIIEQLAIEPGERGYLTIDESIAVAGKPHRCSGAKHARAIHTEATSDVSGNLSWDDTPPKRWNDDRSTRLRSDTKVLIANSVDYSCAIWDEEVKHVTPDGDLGAVADRYPYERAILMKAGDVREMTVCTPHEGLPIKETVNRQFIRIVGSGMSGFSSRFTSNPLFKL